MVPKITADMDTVRKMNMGHVLNELMDKGPLSRAELSRTLHISRSASSSLVDELLQQELVIELEKGSSAVGRKPILIDVNYQAGKAIGVKIGKDTLSCALVGLTGELERKMSVEYNSSMSAQSCIDTITDVVGELQKSTEFPILGLGVGMSGRIDYQRGIFIESSIVPWKHIELASRLERSCGIPVYLENDVNTFALGQNFFGLGKRYTNYACISIGQGIGTGLIMENQLFKGSHHAAGEFGHTKISTADDAHLCSCGNRGCLESYAATPALLEQAAIINGSPLSMDAMIEMGNRGNSQIQALFARAGYYIGIALSNLLNLFDPEIVLIGGEGAKYAHFMIKAIRESVSERTVYGLGNEIPIEVIEYESDLWVRGVAAMVLMERMGIAF
jgi:predicted NBD/HSP70 family sugar kinase